MAAASSVYMEVILVEIGQEFCMDFVNANVLF